MPLYRAWLGTALQSMAAKHGEVEGIGMAVIVEGIRVEGTKVEGIGVEIIGMEGSKVEGIGVRGGSFGGWNERSLFENNLVNKS